MTNSKLNITSLNDVKTLIKDYKQHQPKIVAFDTETDGLNIKFNKPFLLGFGFITNDHSHIYSYTLDYEHTPKQLQIDTMYVVNRLFKTSEEILGHNITYDLHMLDNIGYPIHYPDKYSDTLIYIRLSHDSKKPEEGGPPLDLKGYVARYIDPSARSFQQKLKDEIKDKRRNATSVLKQRLQGVLVPDRYKVSGKEKNWTKAMIDTFFKDSVNEIDDLPKEVASIVKQWYEETPDPDNYRLLNRDNVTEYLHYDIIYTLLIWHQLHNKIAERKQEAAMQTERNAIHAFYTLEKTGWQLDIDYLMQAKEKTKQYLIQLRNTFTKRMHADISAGQHEKIKEQLLNEYNVSFASTNATTLDKALMHESVSEDVKDIIHILKELRTIEKWYSTYILRWIKEYKQFNSTMIYPTYNSVGPVTGRVSSDFQQFPRDSLKTLDGKELFHPREMFLAPKDHTLFYLDYSAMEMRLQAIYTMLVSTGDLNLCRAYIPLECHKKDSTWYLNESPNTPWTPTDLHSLTTVNAFEVSPDDPNFKTYRYLGKRANFAMVYGASVKALMSQLHLKKDDAHKLYNAFYKSYPQIQSYVSYIDAHIKEYGYAQNLFGRKYYGVSTHSARNYLIQGSGADYTKSLLPKLVNLLEPYKSKILGYLHDEFSFIIHKDEHHLIPQLKEIMESLDTDIKLEVDVEYSNSNWREKHDWSAV